MTPRGQWLADWMVEDGAIDRLPDGYDDPHGLIALIEHEAKSGLDNATARLTAARLRERHLKAQTWDSGNPEAVDGYVSWCEGCGQRPWPCDTAQLLAALE